MTMDTSGQILSSTIFGSDHTYYVPLHITKGNNIFYVNSIFADTSSHYGQHLCRFDFSGNLLWESWFDCAAGQSCVEPNGNLITADEFNGLNEFDTTTHVMQHNYPYYDSQIYFDITGLQFNKIVHARDGTLYAIGNSGISIGLIAPLNNLSFSNEIYFTDSVFNMNFRDMKELASGNWIVYGRDDNGSIDDLDSRSFLILLSPTFQVLDYKIIDSRAYLESDDYDITKIALTQNEKIAFSRNDSLTPRIDLVVTDTTFDGFCSQITRPLYSWTESGISYDTYSTVTEYPLITNAYHATFITNTYHPNVVDCTFLDGLRNESEEIQLTIYPNPATSKISFKDMSTITYTIYNNLGNQMLAGEINSNEIDISSLPIGLYQVLLENNSKRFTGRFLKSNN